MGFSAILNGGLPLGTLLLVLEDPFGPHHLLLLRYFLAQGVAHSQPLLLGSPLPSPHAFLGTLPSVTQEEPPSADQSSGKQTPGGGSSQGADGLKIAWQYRRFLSEQDALQQRRLRQLDARAAPLVAPSSERASAPPPGSPQHSDVLPGGTHAEASSSGSHAEFPSDTTLRSSGVDTWQAQENPSLSNHPSLSATSSQPGSTAVNSALSSDAGSGVSSKGEFERTGHSEGVAPLSDRPHAAAASGGQVSSFRAGGSGRRVRGPPHATAKGPPGVALAEFCSAFDLRKPLERPALRQVEAHCVSTSSPEATLPALYSMCSKFASNLPRAGAGRGARVGRVVLMSLGAPHCSHASSPNSGGVEGQEWELLQFVAALKGQLRASATVGMLTVAPALHSPSFVARLQHIADGVLSLEALAEDDKETAALVADYADVTGLLRVPNVPETSAYAIKVIRRRRVSLELLQAPPMDASGGGGDKGSSAAGLLCSAPAGAPSPLDF
eukprot:jgi/Mesen1/4649/ME000241S03690